MDYTTIGNFLVVDIHKPMSSQEDYEFCRVRKDYFDKAQLDAHVYFMMVNSIIHSLNCNAISIAEDYYGMPLLCYDIK